MLRGLIDTWRYLPAPGRWGWVLYLGSMITPARDLGMVGAELFVRLPGGILAFFGTHPANPLPGICAAIGLAANLLVFIRAPWAVSLVAVLVPWIALLGLNAGSASQFQGTLSAWVFYYPWALGVVLISLGRRRRPGPEASA